MDKIASWNDELWVWGGSHWEPLKEQIVRNFIQNEYGDMKFSARYNDHKQIVSVIKDLLPQQIRTSNMEGVNFANGYLTQELKLLDHNPQYGMTYTLPFCYRPELAGKCPRFFEFLESSWGHDSDFAEKKLALQQAICATLFGVATSFQRCFLLYGVAGTGKSVLIEILKAMVPQEAQSAISPEHWGEKFLASQFAGKLLNVAGELEEKKPIGGKRFKEIISGEEITDQHKNKDPFKFRPKAAHWFASNYLPRSKDTSGGFNRRWLILSFNRVVPKSKIVRDLHNIIVYEEVEAIVAWALEAFADFSAKGDYTFPESSLHYLSEMSMLNSTVRQWLKERTVETAGSVVPDHDFYRDYWRYASITLQGSPVSPKSFTLELNQFLGEESKPQASDINGVLSYTGLALKKLST